MDAFRSLYPPAGIIARTGRPPEAGAGGFAIMGLICIRRRAPLVDSTGLAPIIILHLSINSDKDISRIAFFILAVASEGLQFMRCIAVIPARYASARLPGKPLLPIAGKPVIQHVWERAMSCPEIADVCVATDDERIAAAVRDFGGTAVMTSPDHVSGTDRIAEAALDLKADVVVNIQGDEPLIPAVTIREVLRPFAREEELGVTTACTAITSLDELLNPNCVKVVVDYEGNAIYFSRLPVPFCRMAGGTLENYREQLSRNPLLLKQYNKHVGIYAYRKKFLQIFVNLPVSFLEKMEKLEQLRLIEYGYRIRVVEVHDSHPGIDTREDYEIVRQMMEGSPARKPQ
jgi:3-deoxy-manno-octulosonate cytidylyltransferase (CMP-KDO synthetase)